MEIWKQLRCVASIAPGAWDSDETWIAVEKKARTLFAPPPARLPISGMSAPDILEKMVADYGATAASTKAILSSAAITAHRLAQPTPPVDPDADAKRLAWEYYCGMNPDPAKRGYANAHQIWINRADEQSGWRAVAAAQERGE